MRVMEEDKLTTPNNETLDMKRGKVESPLFTACRVAKIMRKEKGTFNFSRPALQGLDDKQSFRELRPAAEP